MMELVENKLFHGETLVVDGKAFKSCDFENTIFIYSGGQRPTFADCQFINVDLQFEDSAANTLQFLSNLRGVGFTQAVDSMLAGVK